MNIHRKIVILVGLGMLLITALVVLSLQNVMTAFSSLTGEVEYISQEHQQIELLSKELGGIQKNIHSYLANRKTKYRDAYVVSHDAALAALGALEKLDLGSDEKRLVASLRSDLTLLQNKADSIFALKDPADRDREKMQNLVIESDGLVEWVRRDLDKHSRDEQGQQMNRLSEYVRMFKKRVLLLFVMILLLSAGFLAGFGVFMHRKVAVPLNDLWKGATQISQGNLDYQMHLAETGDIGQLAERFNEMARQLQRSYSELEKKLLDRTNELAAIDSVALTLSQSGNLKDMLSKSLDQILASLTGLAPKGGIFLCEPDNENLRLVADQGLSADFVQNESTIKMGECLCGIAAQTGEILYSEKGCEDPRHTRGGSAGEHSHIIIPVKSRGIVLGVVFLYPQKDFTLKPSDLQMFDTIGAQLGLAVENLRFYAEVKESSEKFWDLFENSRDILFTMDPAGTLTAVNKTAEQFTGYPKTELVGKSIMEFLTPEGIEIAKRLINGEGATTRDVFEFEVIKRDKTHAFIEMSARQLIRNRIPSGFQVSARDMTEQKLMREKLLSAERIGAIGEIVITVRHEINNPLTTVIGNVELLLERYGENNDDLKKRLEAILNNSLRIAEIVQKLQAIKRDKVVEYVKGVSMTDLKQE